MLASREVCWEVAINNRAGHKPTVKTAHAAEERGEALKNII